MKHCVVNNFFCEFIFFKIYIYVNESLMGMSSLSICLHVSYPNILNGCRRNFILAIYTKRLILIRITQTEIIFYMELKFLYDRYFAK
jgi:hypothetical protein